jgi:hypothetical protein
MAKIHKQYGICEVEETPALCDYATRMELEAQPLTVCQITHPDAVDGAIHEGMYAGIRLVKGPIPGALLSDGSNKQ